jgi:flagellar hook assembly protein FlgD
MDDDYEVVELSFFNLKGELVKKKVPTVKGNRNCSESWDGRDEDGYLVPAGIYFYQIKADKSVYNGAILLAK